MELSDRVGALHDVLKYYWKYDVNITRIESRPVTSNKFDFFVDFHGRVGDANVNALLMALKGMTDKLLVLDEKEVHWFPRHISELDLIANRTLDAGTDLQSDHPGFNDVEYRNRRALLAEQAMKYRMGMELPSTEYSEDEVKTWGVVWDRMEGLLEKHACKEYKKSMNLMKKHCGYSRHQIPQLSTISSFLQLQTSFRLRPVAGLISSRDFLNGLAFRTFFCTQYIRHPSMPLYTPEPDICHELLGHVPMFADRDFCDFSQEIGLASLGASDEDILKLARCYWHSVEFGLCREDGVNKAYGAGLLSSFGELEYACKPRSDDEVPSIGSDGHPTCPQIKPWDPNVAAMQDFPITTYQPVYFLAESLQDAKVKMRKYCEELPRPFFALYNAQMESVHIDRPVRRCVGVPDSSS
jgi:phenylalanine-4-hydroxylase